MKKLLAAALTGAMLVSFASCGKTDPVRNPDDYTEQTEEKTSAENKESFGGETEAGSEAETESSGESAEGNPDGSYHYVKVTECYDGEPEYVSKEQYLNDEGLVIKEIAYSRTSAGFTTRVFEYDSMGNLTRETKTNEDAEGPTLETVDVYYYENNVLVKMTTTTTNVRKNTVPDDMNRVINYSYDDKGNLVRAENYYASGDFSFANDYTYDDNGYLLTDTKTNFEGTVLERHEYKNDANGNVLEHSKFTGYDGENTLVTTYEYDKNGNVIKAVNPKLGYGYEYDADGNLLVTTCYNGKGEVISTSTNQYDSFGRITFTDFVSTQKAAFNHHITYVYE